MSEAAQSTGEDVVLVEGLTIALPDGHTIVRDATIAIREGEVVSLLGPSGAGKSTLLRALFHPDELLAQGYKVTFRSREVASSPAFVPQRGALLDHLDVAGNIALASKKGGDNLTVEGWLRALGLDKSLAKEGRSVAALSGGQAQRVALARALAADRKILVLDEPSVGLDPWSVRLLARLLVEQSRKRGASVLVITHDLTLASGASDKLWFLDADEQRIVPLLPSESGPSEGAEDEQRTARLIELTAEVEELLRSKKARSGGPSKGSRGWDPLAPLRVAGASILRFFEPRWFRPSLTVFYRAIAQSLLRPLLFYSIVGLLLGITVPYVIVHISNALKPQAVLGLIGGSHILSLAPPLSAIVFAATSGSAINAWLGGMRLHGQVVALEGLAISPARYLWSPAWVALALGYLMTVLAFGAAMIAGGWLLFHLYQVPFALEKLTSDFVDPAPSRLPYLVRAVWLVISYSFALASIVVAQGSAPKERSEDVTKAMTSSVMRVTLFVVAMELISVAVLFTMMGGRR